ncbi:MAG: glycosyltransferase [Schleiferiaceae bacterium]|nr:glycosyltransferase [Schleiferiaceae bacterium]
MKAQIQNTLSVCIACYGDDLTKLLLALETGKKALPKEWAVEIIAGDQHPNAAAQSNVWETEFSLQYLHQPNGLGRSNNRNLIAQASTGKYLLFLDADALPVRPENFLIDYCTALHDSDVVVGGTAYKPNQASLRHLIGQRKEAVPAPIRARTPFANFSAFNFAITRKMFLQHPFDESLKEYGHEDTLFGQELRYACKTVAHIDNPAYHLDGDSNAAFLDKTDDAIDNLVELIRQGKIDEEVRLFAVYRKLQRTGMLYLLNLLRILFARSIRTVLIGGVRSVLLFDFYKLLRMSEHSIKIGRRNF